MARNVAVIILYDQDKKILLQHRANDAERLPGYWAFFGGGIEAGETPEQAVKREAFEELQYVVSCPKQIMKQRYTWHGEANEKHVFIEQYSPHKKITLHEGQGFGWFHISELTGLKIIDHDMEVLRFIIGKF